MSHYTMDGLGYEALSTLWRARVRLCQLVISKAGHCDGTPF